MLNPGTVAEAARVETGFEGASRRAAQSYWSESWERLRRDRIAMLCGAVIVVMGALAIAAPLIATFITHHTFSAQDLDSNFASPGTPGHWLGTDELGRDTLTRLIYGAQVSMGVALITVTLSLTVGTTVGLVSGYYGHWVDDVLMRLVDMILSIPRIFLFILVGVLFFRKSNLFTISLVIASVGWGGTARLVRGEVLSLRVRDFMLASRSIGGSDFRLIRVHLLPNVLPILVVAASLGVGGIILAEAALDFLGFGIHPPTPSWGNMLTNAQSYFAHSPWLAFLPGVCIFITVLAANVFGNGVRDAFDPKLK
jgi:peptide/nickel transport system permease protein